MDCTPTRTVAWPDTEIAPISQPHNSSLDMSCSTSIIFTSIPRMPWRTSGTAENVACYTLKHHAAAGIHREGLYRLKKYVALWMPMATVSSPVQTRPLPGLARPAARPGSGELTMKKHLQKCIPSLRDLLISNVPRM